MIGSGEMRPRMRRRDRPVGGWAHQSSRSVIHWPRVSRRMTIYSCSKEVIGNAFRLHRKECYH